jgi:tRNA A-37 threonylcarbamoyl transferase component Bud32
MIEPAADTHRFPRRTLADAGLGGPVLTLFKHDQRSRVWAVQTDAGVRVVKQFVHNPLRQTISRLIGRHPAQLEVQVQRRMRDAGLPVVPVIATGREGAALWLATAHADESLQRRLSRAMPDEAATLIDAAADLTRRIIAAGWTFKDLKPSNIVVDVADSLSLIDVGSARPTATAPRIARMIAVMTRVLARDGVAADLCERYRLAVSRST